MIRKLFNQNKIFMYLSVSLQGVDSGQGPTPFSGFTIWAEISRDASKTSKIEDSKSTATPDLPLGTFQAYDAQTKIHQICAPAADNATGHPKTEIQVGFRSLVSRVLLYHGKVPKVYFVNVKGDLERSFNYCRSVCKAVRPCWPSEERTLVDIGT